MTNMINTGLAALNSLGHQSAAGSEKPAADIAKTMQMLADAGQRLTDKTDANKELEGINAENELLKKEPPGVWKHFIEITKIYRPSREEDGKGNVLTSEVKMGDYIIKVAQQNGLSFKKDKVGNIAVFIPASPGYENAPTTVVQGHQDMVYAKTNGLKHNFEKEPIKLKLKGNILKADNTSLGADNGLGLAMMLSMMEGISFPHGPIVLLATVDEENSWIGMNNIEEGFLPKDSGYCINIDNVNIRYACIGSAGAQYTIGKLKLNRVETSIKNPVLVDLSVKGLTGGHSGVDIDKERASANKLIARVLYKLNNIIDENNNNIPMDLVSINSLASSARKTAITMETSAQIIIPAEKLSYFKQIAQEEENQLKDEFPEDAAHGLQVVLSDPITEKTPSKVIAKDQKNKIIWMLNSIPNGVLAKSKKIKGLVETSTNLGVIKTEGDTLEIGTSQRSSKLTAQIAASESVAAALKLAGFEDVKAQQICPTWDPNPDSKLAKTYMKASGKFLDKPGEYGAIHAGVECAAIARVLPEAEKISIGYTYNQEHTPEEYVEVDSVKQCSDILNDMLQQIANEKK